MSDVAESPYIIARQRERSARLKTEAELEVLTRQIYVQNAELREAQRVLAIATAAADSARDIKEKFIANMSHEIRTPMNAILGMLRLCLQTELSDQQRKYISKVNLASQGLLRIVEDVLDFSRIEAGNLALELHPFELRASLEMLDASISYLADSKALAFTTSVAPDVPEHLVGDPLRLQQVLMNLTSNALKFTTKGNVNVAVSLQSATADAVELQFEVRDTGIGLSPEQVEGLFSAFSQLDMSTTRKFGGTGLGLVISRRLVELMGGHVWVESAVGVGSSFFFTASFDRGEVPESIETAEHEAAPIDAKRLQGRRILVVEDNEFNQEVIQEVLEQWGVEVTISVNGLEALQQLTRETYDIVLMDVQMPVMDGCEATRNIRATPPLARQCVIAMTANVRSEDRRLCSEAGMNDFEPKPIDPDHLYQTLVKWLPETTQPMEMTDMEPIDLAVLGKLLRGDPAKIKKFAEKFLQSSQTVLAEMQVAHKSGDLEMLSRLGHKHKSAAASVGAHGMVALCLAVEKAQTSGSDDEQTALLLVEMQALVDRITLQLASELG